MHETCFVNCLCLLNLENASLSTSWLLIAYCHTWQWTFVNYQFSMLVISSATFMTQVAAAMHMARRNQFPLYYLPIHFHLCTCAKVIKVVSVEGSLTGLNIYVHLLLWQLTLLIVFLFCLQVWRREKWRSSAGHQDVALVNGFDGKSIDKRHLFGVPKDQARRIQWNRKIPRDGVLKPSHTVCDLHFDERYIAFTCHVSRHHKRRACLQMTIWY